MSTAFPIPRSDRRIDLAAAASQTVFTFPYPTLENQDVGVALQAPGATQFTALVYGLDYTVTGAPSSTGVTVTVTTPAASGDVYRLTGARIPSRTTSLAPYGTSYRAALETELDNLTLVLQELRRDFLRLEDFANGGATNVASQAEAQAGADNTKLMTPLRTKEAVFALRPRFSLKDAGAVGNDTAADRTAIQFVMDTAYATGGVIEAEAGSYKITYSSGAAVINADSEITQEPDQDRRQVAIRGQGAGSTVFKNMSSGKYAFKFTGDDAAVGTIEAHNYEVHADFSIIGGTAGANGLWLFNKAYTGLQNVIIQGCQIGARFESVLSSQFTNVQFRNNSQQGCYVHKGAGFSRCNAIQWDSCKWSSNGNLGFAGDLSVTGNVFVNCNFENNGVHAASGNGGCQLSFDGLEGGTGAIFVGGYFESNGGDFDLYLNNAGAQYVTVVLSGVTFNRNIAGRYVTNCIKTTGFIRLVLIGCAFQSYNGYTPNAGRQYVAATDSNLLVEEYNCHFGDAVEATAIRTAGKRQFGGRVSSLGVAVSLPSGWTCVKNSTGNYTVTHNLGNTNYGVTAMTDAGAAAFPLSVTVASNTFTVAVVNSGFSPTDASFCFTMVRT